MEARGHAPFCTHAGLDMDIGEMRKTEHLPRGPLGALAGGIASDYLFQSRRNPPAVISLLLLSAFLILFPYLPATSFAIGCGFFVIGFLIYPPTRFYRPRRPSIVAPKKGLDCGRRDQRIRLPRCYRRRHYAGMDTADCWRAGRRMD
jgi:hypothetical protein